MISETILTMGGIVLLLFAIIIAGYLLLNTQAVTAKIVMASNVFLGTIVSIIIIGVILFLRKWYQKRH